MKKYNKIKVWRDDGYNSKPNKELEKLFRKSSDQPDKSSGMGIYYASKHIKENVFISPKGKIYRAVKKNGKKSS